MLFPESEGYSDAPSLPKTLHCLFKFNCIESEPQIVFIVSEEKFCRPGRLPEILIFLFFSPSELRLSLFSSVSQCVWHYLSATLPRSNWFFLRNWITVCYAFVNLSVNIGKVVASSSQGHLSQLMGVIRWSHQIQAKKKEKMSVRNSMLVLWSSTNILNYCSVFVIHVDRNEMWYNSK